MSPSDPFIDAIADRVYQRIAVLLANGATTSESKLLSIKDVAEILNRTPSSVRGLIHTGELPKQLIKRIGGRVFFVKRDLDAWIKAQ